MLSIYDLPGWGLYWAPNYSYTSLLCCMLALIVLRPSSAFQTRACVEKIVEPGDEATAGIHEHWC